MLNDKHLSKILLAYITFLYHIMFTEKFKEFNEKRSVQLRHIVLGRSVRESRGQFEIASQLGSTPIPSLGED